MYCNQLFYLHFHQDRISYYCPGDEISVTWVNLAIWAFRRFYLFLSALGRLKFWVLYGIGNAKTSSPGDIASSGLAEILSVTLALISFCERWIAWVPTEHCDLWLDLYLKTLSQSLLVLFCTLSFLLWKHFPETSSGLWPCCWVSMAAGSREACRISVIIS